MSAFKIPSTNPAKMSSRPLGLSSVARHCLSVLLERAREPLTADDLVEAMDDGPAMLYGWNDLLGVQTFAVDRDVPAYWFLVDLRHRDFGRLNLLHPRSPPQSPSGSVSSTLYRHRPRSVECSALLIASYGGSFLPMISRAVSCARTDRILKTAASRNSCSIRNSRLYLATRLLCRGGRP